MHAAPSHAIQSPTLFVQDELAIASENAGAMLRAFLASRAKCSYHLSEIGVDVTLDSADDIAASTAVLSAMHEVADELTKEHQNTILDQERALLQSTQHIEQLEDELAAAKAELSNANASLRDSNRAEAAASAREAAAKEDATQAKAALQAARDDISTARGEALEAQRALGSDAAARAVAVKKMEELATRMGSLKQELNEATLQASQANEECHSAEKRLESLQATLRARDETIAELKLQLQAAHAALKDEQLKHEQTQSRREDMATQLQAAQLAAKEADGRAAAADAASSVWRETRRPWEASPTGGPQQGKDGAVSPRSEPVVAASSPLASKSAPRPSGPSSAPRPAVTGSSPSTNDNPHASSQSGVIAPLAAHDAYSRDAAVIADLRMRLADSSRHAVQLQSQLEVTNAKSQRQMEHLEKQMEALAGVVRSSTAPAPLPAQPSELPGVQLAVPAQAPPPKPDLATEVLASGSTAAISAPKAVPHNRFTPHSQPPPPPPGMQQQVDTRLDDAVAQAPQQSSIAASRRYQPSSPEAAARIQQRLDFERSGGSMLAGALTSSGSDSGYARGDMVSRTGPASSMAQLADSPPPTRSAAAPALAASPERDMRSARNAVAFLNLPAANGDTTVQATRSVLSRPSPSTFAARFSERQAAAATATAGTTNDATEHRYPQQTWYLSPPRAVQSVDSHVSTIPYTLDNTFALQAPPASAARQPAAHHSQAGALASLSPGSPWRSTTRHEPGASHHAGSSTSALQQHSGSRVSRGAVSLHTQMGTIPSSFYAQASRNMTRSSRGFDPQYAAMPPAMPSQHSAQGSANFSHPAVQHAIRQATQAVHEVQSQMAQARRQPR